MTQEQYLKELNHYLKDRSEDERSSAIIYIEEYYDELRNGKSGLVKVKNELEQTTIHLEASQEDYEIFVESSLGSISVNDTTQKGIDNTYQKSQNMNLDKKVFIINELGDVKLSFKD